MIILEGKRSQVQYGKAQTNVVSERNKGTMGKILLIFLKHYFKK